MNLGIAYHYSFIFSAIAIALLIPVNIGLVFLYDGNEQLQLMNWNNSWAAHIVFYCLGFATQYINGLKHKLQLELDDRKLLYGMLRTS